MTEPGIHLLLRDTARTTFVLFFFAFTGNALRDLFPGGFSKWLARQRDRFLVAMAVSHTVHLAAIIALFQAIGWAKLRVLTVVGGGLAYLFMYLLAWNALLRLRARRLQFLVGGPRFEAFALYLIWLIFALAFVPRMVSGWPVYTVLGTAALAAFVIRITCLVRHRRARAATA
jgi:methionine sulfoxide reductase heme-binding subunit